MNELEITLERTLSVWWSFVWRAILVSFVAGAFLGFIGGAIVGAAGRPELGGAVGAVIGWLASIPASIWALKSALNKRHGGFRIALFKDA